MSGLTVHRRWEYETARKRTRMLRLRKLSRVQNFKIIAASGLIKGAVRRTNYNTDFSVLFPVAFNPNNNTEHKKICMYCSQPPLRLRTKQMKFFTQKQSTVGEELRNQSQREETTCRCF